MFFLGTIIKNHNIILKFLYRWYIVLPIIVKKYVHIYHPFLWSTMSESETLATFWTVISGLIKTSIRLVRTAFRMSEKLEDSYLKGKLVHAFIEISLDYCGAPFAGLSVGRLSSYSKCSNRVLTGTHKFDQAVLKSLHRLPVQYRITCKSFLLVHKALSSLAPWVHLWLAHCL